MIIWGGSGRRERGGGKGREKEKSLYRQKHIMENNKYYFFKNEITPHPSANLNNGHKSVGEE